MKLQSVVNKPEDESLKGVNEMVFTGRLSENEVLLAQKRPSNLHEMHWNGCTGGCRYPGLSSKLFDPARDSRRRAFVQSHNCLFREYLYNPNRLFPRDNSGILK